MNNQKDLTIIRIEETEIWVREIPKIPFDKADPDSDYDEHIAEKYAKEYKLRVQQKQEVDEVAKLSIEYRKRYPEKSSDIGYAFYDGYTAATLKAKGNGRVWTEVDVKERLPKDDGWYTTFAKDSYSDFTAFENGKFGFMDLEDGYFTPFTDDVITHWLEPIKQTTGFTLEGFAEWLAVQKTIVTIDNRGTLWWRDGNSTLTTPELVTHYIQSMQPYKVGMILKCEVDEENGTATPI